MNAPWQDFLTERFGWSEFSNDKELSKFWKYTNVPDYKTVVGGTRAWCAMILCGALEETGFRSPRNAAASSFRTIGKGIDWKVMGIPKGALVVIRHQNGSYHVTTADRDHAVGAKILDALGGNQHNQIDVTRFHLGPLADQIVAVRWPVPKAAV